MTFRVVLLALLLLGAGALGYRLGGRSEATPAAETTTELRPGSSVVVAIHELARLEGAIYHMERVIDLKQKQSRLFGMIEAQDALLLVAAGDVVAGVDLSRVAEEDLYVDADGQEVNIVLPRAEIFSARVDNDKTYVHTRSTDLLATRSLHLETEARREAERSFRQSAVSAGILSVAEKSAVRTVTALVTSLGYTNVQVSFRDPASAD